MDKAIIIDDDIVTCELISGYLSKIEDISLEKSFTNPLEAISYIKENSVDLVFLDIEMPNINGIEFLKLTKSELTSYIIISAHEKYALAGFELDVVDYLHKPVSFARLVAAVEKFKKRKLFTSKSIEENKEFVFLKNEQFIVKYKKDDISFIKALGDYVSIHIGEERIILHSTMNEVEKKINWHSLIRVHRSYIVNINKIKNIEDTTISCGNELIPIGIRYKEAFFAFIKPI